MTASVESFNEDDKETVDAFVVCPGISLKKSCQNKGFKKVLKDFWD